MFGMDQYQKEYLRQNHALKRIVDIDARLREFVEMYKTYLRAGHPLKIAVIEQLAACKELFPHSEDQKFLLKFALDEYHERIVDRLESGESPNSHQYGGFSVHATPVQDGKSALHYLADRYEAAQSFDVRRDCHKLMRFLLNDKHHLQSSVVSELSWPRRLRIYMDRHGYNYLHGCCLVGWAGTLKRLLRRDTVDDSLMTNYPRSPLHVAAQYRHVSCIEVLLACQVDPNFREKSAEESTALHALSRPCLLRCRCRSAELGYCDCRRQVDRIVEVLLAKGASLELKNKNQDTPLMVAVRRLDVEVTRALLNHGATTLSLTLADRRNMLFDAQFTQLEQRSYALTFDIVQLVNLLESKNFRMDLKTKLRLIKCWMRVRGNEDDHLIPEDTGDVARDRCILVEIKKKMKLYEELAFCQEARRYLQKRHETLVARLSGCDPPCMPPSDNELVMDTWWTNVQQMNKIICTWERTIPFAALRYMSEEELHLILEKIDGIDLALIGISEAGLIGDHSRRPVDDDVLVIEQHWWQRFELRKKIIEMKQDVTLAGFCNMSHEESSLLVQKMSDPYATIGIPTAELTCETACLNSVVKRRVASVLMRKVLNLDELGGDLFTTSFYSLNMTREDCVKVAQQLSNELLLRLFEQTDMGALENFKWDPVAREIRNDPTTNQSFFTDENNVFECLRNHYRAMIKPRPYRLFENKNK